MAAWTRWSVAGSIVVVVAFLVASIQVVTMMMMQVSNKVKALVGRLNIVEASAKAAKQQAETVARPLPWL